MWRTNTGTRHPENTSLHESSGTTRRAERAKAAGRALANSLRRRERHFAAQAASGGASAASRADELATDGRAPRERGSSTWGRQAHAFGGVNAWTWAESGSLAAAAVSPQLREARLPYRTQRWLPRHTLPVMSRVRPYEHEWPKLAPPMWTPLRPSARRRVSASRRVRSAHPGGYSDWRRSGRYLPSSRTRVRDPPAGETRCWGAGMSRQMRWMSRTLGRLRPTSAKA